MIPPRLQLVALTLIGALWLGFVLWRLLDLVDPPIPPATPVLIVPTVSPTIYVFATPEPVPSPVREPLVEITATTREPVPTPTVTPVVAPPASTRVLTPTRVPVQRG